MDIHFFLYCVATKTFPFPLEVVTATQQLYFSTFHLATQQQNNDQMQASCSK